MPRRAELDRKAGSGDTVVAAAVKTAGPVAVVAPAVAMRVPVRCLTAPVGVFAHVVGVSGRDSLGVDDVVVRECCVTREERHAEGA